MDERRDLLEWIFDGLAGIGFLVAVLSVLFRDRYPSFDFTALIYAAVGMALFVAGVAGSRWRKQKRLSGLINGTQTRDGNAN